MNSIQLYIDTNNIFRLQFKDAVHPTLINQRAEHWNFIYQMFHDQILFDSGFFNNNYFVSEQYRILIIEEYHPSILDKNKIETDNDVIKNLRFFDFKNNNTGKFSKLTGGTFLLTKLVDNFFIFSKRYMDKTVEFEIDISKINLVKFALT